MELLTTFKTKVTEVVYVFEDGTSRFHYGEWVDNKGKVYDSILRDIDGNEINDPSLLEEVQNFVDTLKQ